MNPRSFRLALGATLLALFALPAAVVRAAEPEDLSVYLVSENGPVLSLDAAEAFRGLTPKEKQYAYWMARASWEGMPIVFEQLSAESPAVRDLLLRLHGKDRVDLVREATRRGVTAKELTWLDEYSAAFLGNGGNYLNFGSTKFVPRLSEEAFDKVVRAAASLSKPADERLLSLWEANRKKIWSLAPDERALGLDGDGTSTYIGENVTKAEAELVGRFLVAQKIEGWNTRLFERADGTLEVRIASVEKGKERRFDFEGRKVAVVAGDHSVPLAKVVAALGQARKYVANETQAKMLDAYIRHFTTGDLDLHKESQKYWVKDQGPAVETNIGFIETYGDPMGIRAEWEGFVSVVNREQTRKFQALVDQAPEMIALLPWGKPFEKDTFQRPDFSSLDVVAFASSGIPAGINIPNYDDIRMNLGFKNVSLGNVLSGGYQVKDKVQFISDADQELFRKWASPSFEVQVGLHELLGHGSGKLLTEKADGTFNFDRATVNPLTGKPVATWYRPGETWGGKFGAMAGPFEECRAETVAIYLSLEPKVLEIFGHPGAEGADVTYANWLLMAKAGADALRFYDPRTGVWGQAHMQARFAIMNVMLQAGEGLLTFDKNAEGDWVFKMDREKIPTVGRKAIGEFLRTLGVLKATANFEEAKALFTKLTTPDGRFLEAREYGIAKRKPRGVWMQPILDLDANGEVIYRSHPATPRGMIDSWLDRTRVLAEPIAAAGTAKGK